MHLLPVVSAIVTPPNAATVRLEVGFRRDQEHIIVGTRHVYDRLCKDHWQCVDMLPMMSMIDALEESAGFGRHKHLIGIDRMDGDRIDAPALLNIELIFGKA